MFIGYNYSLNNNSLTLMNKLLIILFLSIGLIGCSSIELEAVSTSQEETNRILAMGLTHEENLVEAKKLNTAHMISVVSLQLTNARDEKIKKESDAIESAKFSELVVVSENKSNFVGPELVKTIKKGVLETDIDIQTIYLRGKKNDNGILEHTLIVKIAHVSYNKRTYSTANLCDTWGRCEGDKLEYNLVTSNSTNCSTTGCNHSDVMEFNFSDEFLRSKVNDTGFTNGFTMRINRKRFSNKVNIPSAYLAGYLNVAK
jgi:hypothetical protein